MKRLLLILVTFIIAFAGGVIFVACGTPPTTERPPVPPTLEKSSFSIQFSTDDNCKANYKLTWDAENATQYKVVYGENETVTDKKELLLNDFSADTVHTVTVTAIGQNDLESDSVEIKFKGVKLDMPTDVRMHLDTKSFDWKHTDETSAYVISCEELDLDIATSKPFGTGKFKQILTYSDNLMLFDLRSIYSQLELYSLESFRVQALPYDGNTQWFDYADDTDVIEFKLPSDLSEQSVNFYAGVMTNPYNLRWDFDGFDEHRGYALVKWDGAVSNYKYKVMVQYPEGFWSGTETEKGASQGAVGFGYPEVTGDYTVRIEPECYDFQFIGEDSAEKWATYLFYLPQPTTEFLHFRINQTVIDAPKNARIDGENIVWDAVEHACLYFVRLTCGEDIINVQSDTTQLSLQDIYHHLIYGETTRHGDYDISVVACAIDPELVSFENDLPIINTYLDSDSGAVRPSKIRLKALPVVSNVVIDYVNRTVSWNPVAEATSYFVELSYNGRGVITSVDGTSYTWREDKTYTSVTITAIGGYKVIEEDGMVTLIVPSVYKTEL